MLSALSARINCHLEAVIQGVQTLCRTPISSLLTVLVISVALLFPALLWLSTHSLQQFMHPWKNEGRITLYLQLDLSSNVQAQVLHRVQSKEMVAQATLISPEQGLALLQAQEGMGEVVAHLPHNPLPAMIEVIPGAAHVHPSEVEALYQDLKAIPEVQEAKLDRQWLTRLHAILSFLHDLSDALLLTLAIAVLLIIGNTLRMIVQNRQQDIAVLKLLGASDGYIIRPFLYLGAGYGILGALISLLLLHLFTLSLSIMINPLASLYEMHMPILSFSLYEMIIFIGGAGLLGFIGARLSVKSQLAFIEP